ncbi:hypothetical protein ABZ413_29610 [Nocardia rhamnosiphila]|uniref:hypothetical protein n=1 Tax=Nocardia rhamnosiphila TaxID=426716 RepID=UPI0033C315DD
MLNVYDVVINGVATTVQLSDEDALARGLKPQRKAPTKARTTANRSRAAANKARTAEKANGTGGAGK